MIRVPSIPVTVLATVALTIAFACRAVAQAPGPTPGVAPAPFPASTGESPTAAPLPGSVPSAPSGAASPLAASFTGRASIARVSTGNGTLPNDGGQVWREYDIRPYTLRAGSGPRPEQTIVDWILRQTGYEAWHSDPLGILSATHTTLRVYHTPEMQAVVSEMVDRFVNPAAQSQTFSLRVVSLTSPSWRAKYLKIMHALPVQSQGMQAWLLTKEDASLLFADLRRRSDFREFSSPAELVLNGQSSVVSTVHPHGYTGAITLHPEQLHPGFEPQVLQFDEGFSIGFNPLLSLDLQSADAMVKCDVDQLERVVAATVDVPTPIAPRQHSEIEVPQSASYRIRERFHWPVNQVLMVSFGIIAAPLESEPAIRLSLNPGPPRAELIVFIEHRGPAASPLATAVPNAAIPNAVAPAAVPAYTAVPIAAPPLAGPPPQAPAAVSPFAPLTDRRGTDPFYRSPY